MRTHVNTFLRVSSTGFVAVVLGKIGYDHVWEAARAAFPSIGAVVVFLAVMAGLTALISAFNRN